MNARSLLTEPKLETCSLLRNKCNIAELPSGRAECTFMRTFVYRKREKKNRICTKH